MAGRSKVPPQPTRVMVLAGLLLLFSALSFWTAAAADGEPVSLLYSLLYLITAFLLLANTLIGRYIAMMIGALTLFSGVLVLTLIGPAAIQVGVWATPIVLFLLLMVALGVLIIAMAYPRPDEVAARRRDPGSEPVAAADR